MPNITDASSFIWTPFPAVIFLYKKPMCPATLAFHGRLDSCTRIVKLPAVSEKKSQAHSCTEKCSLIIKRGDAGRAEFLSEEVTQDRKGQNHEFETENSSSLYG